MHKLPHDERWDHRLEGRVPTPEPTPDPRCPRQSPLPRQLTYLDHARPGAARERTPRLPVRLYPRHEPHWRGWWAHVLAASRSGKVSTLMMGSSGERLANTF